VGKPLRRAHRRPARRLARHPARRRHPDRGAHRLREDARRFLTAIDELFREGAEKGALPDEVRVIYVSPLKALSADIHKNLAEPRREIRALAEAMGYPGRKSPRR
jgi:hypothetical protein